MFKDRREPIRNRKSIIDFSGFLSFTSVRSTEFFVNELTKTNSSLSLLFYFILFRI